MTAGGLLLGLDIGTQGVRAVLAGFDGEVVARSGRPLPVPPPGPVQEQEPEDWWRALVAALADLGDRRREVTSLAVSCTSGSVCALDADGDAVGPALLYADRRAVPMGGADASWAAAKLGWLAAERPELVERTARFTSPGGHVTSRLLGRPAPIDVTQALKFGHDPASGRWWPLPVPVSTLPEVVPTGAVLGTLDPGAARATGLPPDAVVAAGATDGVAAQMACRPSPTRWATAIGSTVVWKAVSASRIDVAEHGIYSHKGPDGWWLPGAASNAGGRILSDWASPDELDDLDRSVEVEPTTVAAYPSVARGERFPFVDPDFRPWSAPAGSGPGRYAAEILGVAFVERWGCEVLVGHGCDAPAVVVSTGGAVASEPWTQLRADVLQVPVEVPAEPSSAFGAAVIAGAVAHGGVLAAGEAMVRPARRVDPDPEGARRWSDGYHRFVHRCLDQSKGAA